MIFDSEMTERAKFLSSVAAEFFFGPLAPLPGTSPTTSSTKAEQNHGRHKGKRVFPMMMGFARVIERPEESNFSCWINVVALLLCKHHGCVDWTISKFCVSMCCSQTLYHYIHTLLHNNTITGNNQSRKWHRLSQTGR
jgi:hypothetical protein